MSPLLLALLLAHAPAGDPSAAGSYEDARERTQAAVKLANRDPRAGAEELEDALEELSSHALELSGDEFTLQERALAQLALARSYLALDNAGAAERAMDRALRSALGNELPVDRYGPRMIALHDAREQALEASGRVELELECHVRCSLIIDGRATEALEVSLYAGTYDVLIIALDEEAEVEDLHRTLSFSADEPSRVLEFGKPAPPKPVVEDKAPALVVATPTEVDKPAKRAMPRWAELLIMTAGAGVAVAGGVMWAYDERCPGGQDPQIDFEGCPEVYDSKNTGMVLTFAGAGLFAIGGITLVVDEVRVKRAKHREVALVWTMSF